MSSGYPDLPTARFSGPGCEAPRQTIAKSRKIKLFQWFVARLVRRSPPLRAAGAQAAGRLNHAVTMFSNQPLIIF